MGGQQPAVADRRTQLLLLSFSTLAARGRAHNSTDSKRGTRGSFRGSLTLCISCVDAGDGGMRTGSAGTLAMTLAAAITLKLPVSVTLSRLSQDPHAARVHICARYWDFISRFVFYSHSWYKQNT